jgi:hypothetical protein
LRRLQIVAAKKTKLSNWAAVLLLGDFLASELARSAHTLYAACSALPGAAGCARASMRFHYEGWFALSRVGDD